MTTKLAILAFVCLLSLVLCRGYIFLARRWQILDRPNQRSSHIDPTPHGGGVPLLLAFAVGFVLMGPWPEIYIWLVSAAMLLMAIGVVDDLRGLSVVVRFAVYILLAMTSAMLILSSLALSPSYLLLLAGITFAILWALNLYNFMDGTDGIAATQCVLACAGAAWLSIEFSGAGNYAWFCLLLGASHAAFLLWNWAPARLFMGDAGSIPTGFLLASLACYGAVAGELSFACWAILLAVFITDASWTLCWRVFTGQKFTQPHRSHAYQRFSRHCKSHAKVALSLAAVVSFWLFPLAWLVQLWPSGTVFFVTLAYLPLILGMAKLGKLT
jgi:Fuc2NAc and GlcNAc transferase